MRPLRCGQARHQQQGAPASPARSAAARCRGVALLRRSEPPPPCSLPSPSQQPADPWSSATPPPPLLRSIQEAAPSAVESPPFASLDCWLDEPAAGAPASGAPASADFFDAAPPLGRRAEPVFDVCGVGQCLVDVSVSVPRALLGALDVPHGGRR